jgi:hypothetical protein
MLCGSLLRIFHSRQSTGGAAMVDSLLTHFDPLTGVVPGAQPTVRHLSDLRGCFGDTKAYERAVAAGNPAVYTVVNVDRSSEPGALGFSVNCIRPGSVGAEYHLTRGHLHAERSAAEVYVGVSGSGAMLLQHEHSGECRLVPLVPNSVVYVAGHDQHWRRTARLPRRLPSQRRPRLRCRRTLRLSLPRNCRFARPCIGGTCSLRPGRR